MSTQETARAVHTDRYWRDGTPVPIEITLLDYRNGEFGASLRDTTGVFLRRAYTAARLRTVNDRWQQRQQRRAQVVMQAADPANDAQWLEVIAQLRRKLQQTLHHAEWLNTCLASCHAQRRAGRPCVTEIE